MSIRAHIPHTVLFVGLDLGDLLNNLVAIESFSKNEFRSHIL